MQAQTADAAPHSKKKYRVSQRLKKNALVAAMRQFLIPWKFLK